MQIFLTTKSTNLAHPDLISLALVAANGQEFYAERTDYRQNTCSTFVREAVIPLLNRIPNAPCNRTNLTDRLHTWFNQFPDPTTIIFKLETDWILLTDAILGQTYRRPPVNFGEHCHLDTANITDPMFEAVTQRAYTPDNPPQHALSDARALKSAFIVWRMLTGHISR